MPYLVELLLFLVPFGLYAAWLRLNPGRTVGSHALALAAVGLVLSIGGAVWYGLSRGMDPGAAYVPPRATVGGIEAGHSSAAPAPWRPGGAPVPPPPYEGPRRGAPGEGR